MTKIVQASKENIKDDQDNNKESTPTVKPKIVYTKEQLLFIKNSPYSKLPPNKDVIKSMSELNIHRK